MADQRTELLKTLMSMFPDVDAEICETILDTNNGELELSINSLLGMSDPNYKSEESIPVQTESGVTSSSRQQIESDEELARYLAAEADRELGPPPSHLTEQQHQNQDQQQQQQQSPGFPDFSEKLPVIKEKIIQAADTTKKKMNEWYEKLKQQTSSPRNENQFSTPQYTNLPKDEADNPMLGEDFSESLNSHKNNQQQNTINIHRTTSSSLESRPKPSFEE